MTESQYDAIKELCYKYYSKRNLAHALSVEEYITNESFYYCAPEDAQYQMRAVAPIIWIILIPSFSLIPILL